MQRTIRYAALAAAVVAGGAVVLLRTLGSDAAVTPASVPAASQFAAGACRDAAGAVRTLASVTARNAGSESLSKSVRNELVAQGNKLVTARSDASPEVATQMTNLLAQIGYVRISVGKSYSPELLSNVETARVALQQTCTAG